MVDLQAGIVATETAPYPTSEVVERSGRLAEGFRARRRWSCWSGSASRPTARTPPPGRTEAAPPGGPRPEGWDVIVDELAGHPEDVVVTKRNWGAFHGTGLDTQLRRRGITQVFLTGVATGMGVESTARQAHEHGYHVVTVTDAMTDRDASVHRNSVTKIFPRLGETTTTAEVLAALRA